MFRLKPTASVAALMVLALLLAGCFGGLVGVTPGPSGTPPTISQPGAFPSDDLRDQDLADHVPGEILVGVESESVAERIADKLDATVTGYLPQIGLAKLELNDKSRSLTDAMRSLRDEPGVRYAQANFIDYVLPMTQVEEAALDIGTMGAGFDQFDFIDDPNSDYNKYQYGVRLIRADAAWQEGLTGEGTILAVIDTGVESTHPFLAGKVLPGYNPDEPGAGTEDWQGHGTHVAGIAAGAIHAGRGFSGIAPDAQILPIRVFNDDGATNWAVSFGLLVAADPSWVGLPIRPADVANMSLGGAVYSLAVQDAVNFALDRGVVVVVSMGNTENQAVRYPAAYQGVIAVGASDAHDDKTDFSTTGRHISVIAPGHFIYSSYNLSRVAWASGTSMSAPHVSGAALLLKQLYPEATPAQIKDLLERTADFRDDYTFNAYGHGRINLANAIAADLDGRPLGGIEVYVYGPGGTPVPGAEVTLWRGQGDDKAIAAYPIRTGGYGDTPIPYHGMAFFRGVEPGDDYWMTVTLDEYLHGEYRLEIVENISVRADETTFVRVQLDF